VSSSIVVATEAAREAGALLMDFYQRRIPYQLKGEFDLVTEADKAAENLIVGRLKKEFPDHTIVAEEGGGQERHSEYEWFIDPLDGTTNFAHSFPVFAVSIGLQRQGQMIAGVVFDPTRNELFTAEHGGGAFMNGDRLRVSNTSTVEASLVATGFPSRRRHLNVNVHFYYQLAMLSHGVRRAGAAALDLAYVACGRLDGFWEFGLKPWDMAAGWLLVEEAGGIATDMQGQPLSLESPHMMADNRVLHQELLSNFNDIFAGKQRFPMVEIPA
jgi:myo-inositol-1(or 4)-monophosphatase